MRRVLTSLFFNVTGRVFVAAALLLTGCSGVVGDFDGIAFNPRFTEVAVADRHDIVRVGGQDVATRLPDGQISLTLLFTAASAGPNDEWRRYSARRVTELRTELAILDGLLIENIAPGPTPGSGLTAERSHGRTGGDFDFYLGAGGAADADRPLGDDVTVTLNLDAADDSAGGTVAGEIAITRTASDTQDDAAEGTVSISFSLPLGAERRTKANLALAAPIIACAADNGPTRAAACATTPSSAIADENAF